MSANRWHAAILIAYTSPFLNLRHSWKKCVWIASSLSSLATLDKDLIAFFWTTESSEHAIISKGLKRCAQFYYFSSFDFDELPEGLRCSIKLPSYSARFIISSGLLSILSMSSVSIGTSSSTHLSGPSSCAI